VEIGEDVVHRRVEGEIEHRPDRRHEVRQRSPYFQTVRVGGDAVHTDRIGVNGITS
jgi:hypothetical protein